MLRVYLKSFIIHHHPKIFLNIVHYDEQRGEGLWRSYDNDIVNFDCEHVLLDLAQTNHDLELP